MAETSLIDLLRRLGLAAFRTDDEFARQHGWQVAAGRLGLSRTYRDPRFDGLARCSDCHGSGRYADAACDRCSGTGRVTLGQPSAATMR